MTLALQGKSKRRQGLLGLAAIIAVMLGFAAAVGANDSPAFATDTGSATLATQHVGASTNTFGREDDCGPYDGEFDFAFHFVFQGSSTDFTSISATFTGGTQVHSTFDGKHAYVYVNDTGDAGVTLTGATGGTVHNGGQQDLDTTFNLSHICDGDGGGDTGTLIIDKTVDNTGSNLTATAGTFGSMSLMCPVAPSKRTTGAKAPTSTSPLVTTRSPKWTTWATRSSLAATAMSMATLPSLLAVPPPARS